MIQVSKKVIITLEILMIIACICSAFGYKQAIDRNKHIKELETSVEYFKAENSRLESIVESREV